ncbi:MAG: type II toxin-antitoxin system ParD family antitoxin [Planctomycetes bacterium]|nr:type II toxin-antitoxin system ParD family antitoxin [Planctomycetota bacterium]
MTIDLSESAQNILDRELSTGAYASATEVLDVALRDLAAKREREETIQAIREGVAAAEAGDTYSVEEVFDELYEEFPNLKAD